MQGTIIIKEQVLNIRYAMTGGVFEYLFYFYVPTLIMFYELTWKAINKQSV